MRILIAEDDRTSRDMLDAILRKLGHDVVSTSNGKEAWDAMCGPQAPMLVILDRMMPELDGLELTRRLRGEEEDCEQPRYILMLTALGSTEHIAEGLDAGANDYLVKPVSPVELRARIDAGRRLLRLHELLAERNEELRKASDEIRTLRGVIPICMHCKNIRDDKSYWTRLEDYISSRTDAEFSHGLCPECDEKYYSEV